MTNNLPVWLSNGMDSMQWLLTKEAHQPMYLKSLQELKDIRGRNNLDTCTCHNLSHTPCPLFTFDDFCFHLPESLEWILPPTENEERWFAIIVIAIVLLGNGYTDEAHCLLAPLSYPTCLKFGYGPNVFGKLSDEAVSYASHVHGLVHRREGPCVSEFDKSGFFNAHYWSSIVFRSPGVETLPHVQLYTQLTQLLQSYSQCSQVQAWFHSSGIQRLKDSNEPCYYEARYIHALCETVLHNDDDGDDDTVDPLFRQFAQDVCEMELRVMLQESLRKARFINCTTDNEQEKEDSGQRQS